MSLIVKLKKQATRYAKDLANEAIQAMGAYKSLQTANTIVYADNAYMAKQLGEAQYGVGNVLNYTEVN